MKEFLTPLRTGNWRALVASFLYFDTGTEDEDTMRRAIRAGVAAYVAHGISARDIAPILKVAALRYAEYRHLRKELKDTQNALSERKLVEKAKGILMRDMQIDEAEAYRRLRRLAMDKGKKLAGIAEMVIAICP